MRARCWLVAATLVVLPEAVSAQGIAGRFTIAAQIGTQSEVSGNMLQSAQGTLFDQPISIDSKRYRDVYAPALRLQGLFGYGVGERTEVVAKAGWYKADATRLVAGTLAGEELVVGFEPYSYEEVGIEVAFRYYLSTQGRLKSYIAPVGGVRFLHEILVAFSAQAAGSSIQNVPFSQKGAVAVFGADIGFTFDLGEHFLIGVDTGIRYQGPAKQYDYLLGLTQIDDSDGRWTAPVVAVVGLKF